MLIMSSALYTPWPTTLGPPAGRVRGQCMHVSGGGRAGAAWPQRRHASPYPATAALFTTAWRTYEEDEHPGQEDGRVNAQPEGREPCVCGRGGGGVRGRSLVPCLMLARLASGCSHQGGTRAQPAAIAAQLSALKPRCHNSHFFTSGSRPCTRSGQKSQQLVTQNQGSRNTPAMR